MLSGWAVAGLAGVLIGSALFLGALLGWTVPLTHRGIATTMGFGAGVLIAVVSLELLEEAHRYGGLTIAVATFLAGALIFSAANVWLSRRGAKHRKRCGECVQQPSEAEMSGSGLAIAVGTLVDAVPESLVIGLDTLLQGISLVVVAGFFLANFPQGMSGAAGMKEAGRPWTYVLGVWGGLAVLSGIMPIASYLLFRGSSPIVIAVATATAAGGALAMATETMIPEAFDRAPSFSGVIIAVGFMAAFLLGRVLMS